MNQIKQYIQILNAPKFYPGLVLLGSNIILVILLIFIAFKAQEQYAMSQTIQQELVTTKENINLIRNNQSLLSNNIEDYNQLLGSLVPDDESYFSVISALDALEAKTGAQITSYSINLDSTTAEKLSLQVTSTGTKDQIEQFLKLYPYSSGRLLTSETVLIGEGVETSYTFTINFYHKKYEPIDPGDRKITQKDLDFLNEIKAKM